MSKIKQSPEVNKTILNDLLEIIKQTVKEEDFEGTLVNTVCSEYLKKVLEDPNCTYRSDDVFFLFRFAMTGNPVGASIGDISHVIGLQSVLLRIK